MAAEVACGDGMSAIWTAERGQAMLHFNGVISHNFKCSRLYEEHSEPKFPRRELGLIRVAGERIDLSRSLHFRASKVKVIFAELGTIFLAFG